ncbi:PHD finger-containing protein 6-like [Quercus suber]|uniref:PHD finger-containing protein 6-like n=1 Tax=Quercus suber TaxID=58331 RepID=UPI0032DF3473
MEPRIVEETLKQVISLGILSTVSWNLKCGMVEETLVASPMTRSTDYKEKFIEQAMKKIQQVNTGWSILPSNLVALSNCCSCICVGGKFQAFFKRENSDAEESELLNSLLKFKLYRDYLPALHATWRGSILVAAKPGDIYRGLLAQTGDIYRGLRAQPPRTVSGRAYELSLRLPLTLRVMLLPRSQIWADLFQNDYPDLNDIALYFSPDDKIERSKESISCLSELMEDENLILRIRIEGVDLLIFTSKQLHVDSQNAIARLEAGYVLWGIFLPVRDNQTQEPARVESSIRVASTSVIDKYRHFLGDIKAGSEPFSLRTKTSPTVYTLSQS